MARLFNVSYGLNNPNDPDKKLIGTFVNNSDATYQYQVVGGKVVLVCVRRNLPIAKMLGSFSASARKIFVLFKK